MSAKSIVLICVFSLLCIVGKTNAGCGSYTASDGSKYDLDPLTLTTGDYSGTEPGPNNYIYYWNYCHPVKATTGCPTGTVSGQIYQGSCTPIGYMPERIKDGVSGPKSGVTITYVNNADNKCGPSRTIPRQTILTLVCDKGGVESSLVSITEPGTCIYDITIKSKYACPIGGGGGVGGLSGGWVFVIILICGTALYLIVGVVVKWQVMHTEPGVELIPNIDFWRELPGLIKDGFFFVKSKITGAAGYSSL